MQILVKFFLIFGFLVSGFCGSAIQTEPTTGIQIDIETELSKKRGEFVSRLSYFYINPKLSELESILNGFIETKLIGFDENTSFSIGVFYALFKQYPEFKSMVAKRFKELEPEGQIAVLYSIWKTGKDNLPRFTKLLGEKDASSFRIKDYTNKLMEQEWADLVTQEIQDPKILDQLWGAYFTTGENTYLHRIISTMKYPCPKDEIQTIEQAIPWSAHWSVASNAIRHNAVYKELQDYLSVAPSKVQTLLEDAFFTAGVQRSKFKDEDYLKFDYPYLFELKKENLQSQGAAAVTSLAECYLYGLGTKKDIEKGEELLSQAAKQNDVDAYLQLGVLASFKQKKTYCKESLEFYRKAMQLGSAKAKAWVACYYLYGEIVEKSEEQGLKLLMEALKEGSEAAYSHLYRYYKDIEEYDKAEIWLNRALEKGITGALMNKASILKSENEHLGEMKALLRQAARKGNTTAMFVYLTISEIPNQVLKDNYRKVQAELETKPEYQFEKGMDLLMGRSDTIKNEEEGKAWLEKAAKQGHAMAANNLAYTLAEEGKNLDYAMELVWQALETEPEDAYIMDTVAWIYFKQKKYLKALYYISKAIDEKDSDNEVKNHITQICDKAMDITLEYILKGQRLSHAMAILKKIIEINPENGRAYFLKSRIHFCQNNIPEAVKSSLKSLELEPDNKLFKKHLKEVKDTSNR